MGGRFLTLAGAVAVAAIAVPYAAGTGSPPKNLVPPAVSGTPAVGKSLISTTGTWTGTLPITYRFQWQRCSSPTSCAAILGATTSTYPVASADLGKTLVSSVTAVNIYGQATAKSTPTGVVAGSGGGGGQVQTGASLATCSTSPCQSGAAPSGSGNNGCTKGAFGTNMVALGNINGGAGNECRLYGYYKPANLSGHAAAVLIASGANGLCGPADVSQVFKDSRWQHVADANRLVLLVLSKPSAPSCRGAWYHPNIDVPGPEGPGSDEPYLGAVLSDAIARLGLDSQRIYLTGASSGGSLVYDAACDALNSAKFRGFAAVSAFMEARVSSGRPVVGSERCGTLNNHFFFQNVHGTSDGNVPFGGSCDSTHCIVSFAENARWWAQHMGCAAKPTVTMIGTPTKANEQDDYGTCAFGSPAASYESIKVQNGCHAWSGLDAQPANPSTCAGNPHTNNTNAFYTAQSDWNWFATRSWIG